MKPIEKYQEKFIALLKEAEEEELGAPLDVSVKCRVTKTIDEAHVGQAALHYATEQKEYICDIGTSGRWY